MSESCLDSDLNQLSKENFRQSETFQYGLDIRQHYGITVNFVRYHNDTLLIFFKSFSLEIPIDIFTGAMT